MARIAERRRATRETEVSVKINLDGSGAANISTGIGFFDHMLEQLARHGLFDLEISCRGDLHVDNHHTVEDVAIALGQAFLEALGEKRGIERFGWAYVPLDEALARAAVDLSGRPFIVYKVPALRDRVGDLEVELVEHFWRSFAHEARLNLHLELLYGSNQHHVIEAAFKAAARALSAASRISDRIAGVPSTKGAL